LRTVEPEEPLVDIAIEPWDIQEYILKRVFNMVFVASGLSVLMPVITIIAVAIKFDSLGPVLYQQDRTATFGEAFSIYKSRSMIPDAEAETGVELSAEDTGGIDPRVTQVGRFLRATHLSEIPQLWLILRGM
jgi:lipopolysaccharide/colanic/teichoic acid biosynthesis glycosyltransferase